MKNIQCILLSIGLLAGMPVFGKTVNIKKVGEYPNFLALSPDGKTAYVTSYGTGELIEVDLAKRIVTSFNRSRERRTISGSVRVQRRKS